jgi:hypothetical protein
VDLENRGIRIPARLLGELDRLPNVDETSARVEGVHLVVEVVLVDLVVAEADELAVGAGHLLGPDRRNAGQPARADEECIDLHAREQLVHGRLRHGVRIRRHGVDELAPRDHNGHGRYGHDTPEILDRGHVRLSA